MKIVITKVEVEADDARDALDDMRILDLFGRDAEQLSGDGHGDELLVALVDVAAVVADLSLGGCTHDPAPARLGEGGWHPASSGVTPRRLRHG